MLLENMTMEDFKELLKKTKTIIFPFGAVEEHGRHLPLNTDTLIIYEILKKAAMMRDVFIAPPMYYGVCTSTAQHPGTISISANTLRHLTRDLIKEAYKKGLRNFLLLSGHAGSMHIFAMKEVCEALIEELDGVKIAVLSPYDSFFRELFELCETPNDSHAGELETSLVMALAPNLVKCLSEEEYPNMPKPFIVKDKVKYWQGGVWGNPKKASKEKGEQAIKIIIEKVLELIDSIETSSL
ncbi:Creatininase [Candidatus Magnetoovum chiemensis]|nr:Creatininase [Candidatus Magnetoovum chiemensis]